jgi:hypothetical protein
VHRAGVAVKLRRHAGPAQASREFDGLVSKTEPIESGCPQFDAVTPVCASLLALVCGH